MSLCGTCRQTQPSPVLFQIRESYRARWQNLTFSVQSENDQWTLRVQDPSRLTPLYTAHRASAPLARLAAADFAAFQGNTAPLTWQAYR
jgi:hypothetical protein